MSPTQAAARLAMPLVPSDPDVADLATMPRQKAVIRNVDFFYDNFQALKNVSLPLHDKRVTAFIGPSGCGKSTLLRILNRIYQLYPGQRATGEVLVDGENILAPGVDLNLLRARIGMVFQKPTPFPMSIYDNIAFGIRLYERLPHSELDDRVDRRRELALCEPPHLGDRVAEPAQLFVVALDNVLGRHFASSPPPLAQPNRPVM